MLLFFVLPALATAVALVCFGQTAQAVQTVPYKMNFQGRLTDAAGTPKPDGIYNIKFRIYNAANTAVWTEDRLVSATQGVQVTGGLFTVQLGSITPLNPALFNTATTNQNGMTLEVELPTPATATSSSPSWTEGAMTPRSPLATSAYAFNSDTLDGLDSSAFAASSGSANYIQNGTSPQTASFNITGAGTVGGNLTVNGSTLLSVTSATALQIQNAGGSGVLTVDTSNSEVVVGTPTNGIKLSSSGILYIGTAQPLKHITFSPEYPGATFTGDGTNNIGTLGSDFCSSSSLLNINAAACGASGDEHNYYSWTTAEVTAQDYDLYVRYRIPSDYATGSMTDMKIFGWGTTSASEVVSLSLYKGSATACSTITNAITGNMTWNEGSQASPLGGCTIVAGDMVTFRVRVVAGQDNTARAGEISFSYRSKM